MPAGSSGLGGEVHVLAVVGEFGGGGDDVIVGVVLAQAVQVGLRKIFFDVFGVVFLEFFPIGPVLPEHFDGGDIKQAVVKAPRAPGPVQCSIGLEA